MVPLAVPAAAGRGDGGCAKRSEVAARDAAEAAAAAFLLVAAEFSVLLTRLGLGHRCGL